MQDFLRGTGRNPGPPSGSSDSLRSPVPPSRGERLSIRERGSLPLNLTRLPNRREQAFTNAMRQAKRIERAKDRGRAINNWAKWMKRGIWSS